MQCVVDILLSQEERDDTLFLILLVKPSVKFVGAQTEKRPNFLMLQGSKYTVASAVTRRLPPPLNYGARSNDALIPQSTDHCGWRTTLSGCRDPGFIVVVDCVEFGSEFLPVTIVSAPKLRRASGASFDFGS
jgi:hypothetical protein